MRLPSSRSASPHKQRQRNIAPQADDELRAGIERLKRLENETLDSQEFLAELERLMGEQPDVPRSPDDQP